MCRDYPELSAMAIVAAERNNNEGSEDDVEKRLDERLRGSRLALVMAEYGNSLEIFKLFSQSGESRLGFELIRSRTRAIVGNRGCSSRVTMSYMSHIGRLFAVSLQLHLNQCTP